MKVVLINKTDVGGGAAVAANRLKEALRQEGVDASMLVQDAKQPGDGVVAVGDGFMHRQKAFYRFVMERLLFLPHEKNALERFAFSPANTGIDISHHPLVLEADIIHLHWVNQGFLSLESLQKLFSLGKPVVWTLHDMWSFTGGCHYSGSCLEFLEHCAYCPFLKKPGKNDLSARLFKQKKELYKHVSMHVVTCSKWLKSLSNESTLLRSKIFHQIPNPIDTNFYQPRDKKQCREKLGLPRDKKLVLFGAANVEDTRKGMRYLLEALDILKESFPLFRDNVELLVFGKMPKGKAKTFPFKTHSFKFVSDHNVLVDLYNAADIFVLPSLQDNLPNTVMESMACGTPVVGFRIGGVPEMIDHEESGFLAEVRNALSLATGMHETLFLSDFEQMGAAARAKVVKCYSQKVVAQRYLTVYNEALANR